MLARLVLLISIWGLSCAAAAIPPETIFQDAEAYTVRIKTRIERAFGDDKAGVFSGAGFVVDSERGWIVTNKHVVGESPSNVRISTKGNDFVEATKVYVDTFTDIAIIHADVASAGEAALECKSLPGTGHPVGAYGHPWGLDYTGTQGVISGRTDNFRVDLLQTDAPINSGNSGGPLISMRTGKVVGISTASYAHKDAENTNFAVPSIEVCNILALLKDGRDPSPPHLPVAFYNLEDRDELIVAQSYLSADQLDLKTGDRILTVGNRKTPINKEHELINALRGKFDDFELTIERDEKLTIVHGQLEPLRLRQGIVFAGMVLAKSQFLDANVLSIGHGINIHSFVPGSSGRAAKINWYDFIVSVDGTRVKGLEHLFTLLSDTTVNESVELEFMRLWQPPFFYEFVRRTIAADEPVWLDDVGYWNGVMARLTWQLATVNELASLNHEEREKVVGSLRRVIHSVGEPETEIPEEIAAELILTAQKIIDHLSHHSSSESY